MGEPNKGDDKLPEPPDQWLPLLPGEKGGLNAPPPLGTKLPGMPNIYDPSAPPPYRPLPPGVQGPVPANLRIADGVLETAAGRADSVHDAFYKAAASLEELTNGAVKGVDGLATADALKQSHKQWEEQSGRVTAWLTNIAKSLRMAETTYKGGDKGVKDSFSPLIPGTQGVQPPGNRPYLTPDGYYVAPTTPYSPFLPPVGGE
ncbi:hypothetical protein [Streptomyces palmae]|uniref:Uncharacterized protein n=1 Tax=Streptomyces palmae TaxID=1701085 RepID=A0A4Z0H5M5_9ACTN|nr:hypothetical protein [Streptomyces palmae]TGB06942.1 hypothetical protein E4099_17830 [Streptomyces palmae]